jgi:hypothetical protein
MQAFLNKTIVCATLRARVLSSTTPGTRGPTIEQMQRIVPGEHLPRCPVCTRTPPISAPGVVGVPHVQCCVLYAVLHLWCRMHVDAWVVTAPPAFRLLFQGPTPAFPVDVSEFGDVGSLLPADPVVVRWGGGLCPCAFCL